ncbi:hypothetical protein MCBG_03797 [Micromonospora sp. M42]|nr:hypothetical protein MCBG_03797 [Micromonospora sp. M42]
MSCAISCEYVRSGGTRARPTPRRAPRTAPRRTFRSGPGRCGAAASRRAAGGLDPAEVAAFLDRVAGDLAAAYAEVARSREETARIKGALREWQSRQAPSMRDLAGRP